ncbi:hypothetical protein IC575_017326 [Cucumis melo]
MIIENTFWHFSSFCQARVSQRIRESVADPSQLARTYTKSPLVSQTPSTLFAIYPFCVLNVGRFAAGTFTFMYVPSNVPR